MEKASDFMSKYKAELIKILDFYLSGNLSHQEINDFAWDIIVDGEAISNSEPYEIGEDVFWCTVWSIQHLADEEHMESGSIRNELNTLLKLLKTGEPLPEGWVGKRPLDK